MQPDVTGLCLIHGSPRCLARTLESFGFCTRILLVDSGSAPETLAIARRFGAEVVFNPWQGFRSQYLFALERVRQARGDWLFILDQDEHLPESGQAEIRKALATAGPDAAGFHLPRRSFYFDRFIDHSGWHPDHLLRLFRPHRCRLEGGEVHERWVADGPAALLAAEIVHYPYANLDEHFAKIGVYAQAGAERLHAQGRRCGLAAPFVRAIGRFLRHYLLKAGFLDGRAGLVLATQAAVYGFQKYLRLYELTRLGQGRDGGPPDWRGGCP